MKLYRYFVIAVLLFLISCKDNSNKITSTEKPQTIHPSLDWNKIPEAYEPTTAITIKDLIEDTNKKNIAKYAYKSEFETTSEYEARISKNPMSDQPYWFWIDHNVPYERKENEKSHGNFCGDSVNIRYDADLQKYDVSLTTFNNDSENPTSAIRIHCYYWLSNEGEIFRKEKTIIEVDNLKQSDIDKIRASVPMPIDQAIDQEKKYTSNKPFNIILIGTPNQKRGRNITRVYSDNEKPRTETHSIAMNVTDAWIINWRTRDVLKKIHFTDSH